MLVDFFGLREDPFGVTPETRFLYPSGVHEEARASLAHSFQSNRGFVVLVGQPGMGKTTLLMDFLQKLKSSARTAFLFQTQCSSHEFLEQVMIEFSLGIRNESSAQLHDRLRAFLAKEHSSGKRVVMVIDEAQNLQDPVLETVRLLSDFETQRTKLLHIVLSGQPQLTDKLLSPALLQLRQRIGMVCRLSPLTASETREYIEYRLMVAGRRIDDPLFSHKAYKMIADLSRGIPRNINNICFHALSIAYPLNRSMVDADIIEEATTDIDLANEVGLFEKPCVVSAPEAPAGGGPKWPRRRPKTRTPAIPKALELPHLVTLPIVGAHPTPVPEPKQKIASAAAIPQPPSDVSPDPVMVSAPEQKAATAALPLPQSYVTCSRTQVPVRESKPAPSAAVLPHSRISPHPTTWADDTAAQNDRTLSVLMRASAYRRAPAAVCDLEAPITANVRGTFTAENSVSSAAVPQPSNSSEKAADAPVSAATSDPQLEAAMEKTDRLASRITHLRKLALGEELPETQLYSIKRVTALTALVVLIVISIALWAAPSMSAWFSAKPPEDSAPSGSENNGERRHVRRSDTKRQPKIRPSVTATNNGAKTEDQPAEEANNLIAVNTPPRLKDESAVEPSSNSETHFVSKPEVASSIGDLPMLSMTEPLYPAGAQAAGLEGTVVLDATVDGTGRVIELQPVSGNAQLIGAAMRAVKEWRYDPQGFSARHVPVHQMIRIVFTLR